MNREAMNNCGGCSGGPSALATGRSPAAGQSRALAARAILLRDPFFTVDYLATISLAKLRTLAATGRIA